MTNEAVQTAHSQRLVELMRGATWNGVSVDDLRARKSAVEREYAEAVRQREAVLLLLREHRVTVESAVEILEDYLGSTCNEDCDCILHDLRAFLSNFPEEAPAVAYTEKERE